jgi:FKBP-type peptidyl-prolyl cis-trans isomerase SlpA
VCVDYGARVVVRYRLTLADGTLVDESGEGEPLVFAVGDGTLEQGLEARLLGLRAGARVTFYLAPGEAFGPVDPQAVHRMPREDFPPEMGIAPGAVVGFAAPSGLQVVGTVLDVRASEVEVDFSHPLAGRALVFEVEVAAVTAENSAH